MINIELNCESIKTEHKSALALRDSLNKNAIIILNGFILEKDLQINSGDSLVIIEKGKMPSSDELEATMVSRHTPKVHQKVKNSKVAIAGLGGLGSNIAVMLARIGVGELLLIDFDIVEPSNLNRQSYYIKHLGMNKTDALKEQLKEINPFIKIITKNIKIDESNLKELFASWDIVCEAFYKADQKAMLINGILQNFPDKKIVSGSGMAGYDSSNKIVTKKALKNLFICGDLEAEAKVGMGLMAPRVTICAAHQANMILRLILDIYDV